jgi:hypothetical protein
MNKYGRIYIRLIVLARGPGWDCRRVSGDGLNRVCHTWTVVVLGGYIFFSNADLMWDRRYFRREGGGKEHMMVGFQHRSKSTPDCHGYSNTRERQKTTRLGAPRHMCNGQEELLAVMRRDLRWESNTPLTCYRSKVPYRVGGRDVR